MPIFGHSKFIPVVLGKIVRKKFGTAIFGHSEFIPVFLGNIVGKNLKWPFLAVPNLYQSFGENLEQPFLAILNLYQSFWGKLLEKIQNGHFWPF